MKKIMTMVLAVCMAFAFTGCYTSDGRLAFGTKKDDVKPAVTAQPTAEPTEEATQEPSEEKEIVGVENIMNPIVTITMENGMVINIELYPDKAPNTVKNFISLVNQGYYDGLIFHRIIDGFMIQGGDPQGTGRGGPGYYIPGEFSQNGFAQNDIAHVAGVMSMARSQDMDSAGSQFFLMVGTSPHLDGLYAAFGKTVDEQSLANCLELAKLATDTNDRPIDPPVIKSITVDTKGVDYEEPEHS